MRSSVERRLSRPVAKAAGALAAAALLAVSGSIASAQTLPPLSFIQQQATQGQGLFGSSCSSCHGEMLQGLDGGPPLKGEFFARWFTGPVGDLFSFMKANMPADDPGSLTDVQYVRILAYILGQNGFVPGTTPLPEADPGTALAGLSFPPL